MSDLRNRVPPFIVIEGSHAGGPAGRKRRGSGGSPSSMAVDVEWSILMARAQDGDADAYRRLLEEITPLLRSLSARRHRDPNDVEDAMQDILLTIHAVRQTYDPTRPFTPWLVTIAKRRLVDRLRRQGRLRSRETVLTAEYETFSVRRANIETEISDRHELDAALDGLSAGQRQAIRLLKLEELSLKEAAARTGMSITALKVASHRALKSLRKLLVHRSEDT
ncbi:MAG: sigma-70 family RNA polymerase sigma factor [Alphaproteobacteria bacterium]|nr:sigma-70 family RNA polymerase sigma factor [Alphaproteobacteria bacterium]